jgi:hypothetical protein
MLRRNLSLVSTVGGGEMMTDQEFQEEQFRHLLSDMRRDIARSERMLKRGPSYAASAFSGALIGMVANFLASRTSLGGRPGDRALLRYMAAGAAAAVAVDFIALKVTGGVTSLEKSFVRFAEENPEAMMYRAAPPPSPIVTKGAFAGMQRPLHPTTDAPEGAY